MFAFKKKLLNSSRRTKQLLVSTVDFISVVLATLFALYISGVKIEAIGIEQLLRLGWLPFSAVLIFALTGVYRSIVRYIDFSFIYLLIFSIFIAFSFNLIAKTIFDNTLSRLFENQELAINLEGWVAGLMCAMVLLVGSRLVANYYFSDRISGNRVVIYGAGAAGIQLASALRVSSELRVIAFLDRNPLLHNTFLGGVKVLHPRKLEKLSSRGKIDEVLIAMPSASRQTLSKLLKEIEDYSIKVRILPGLADLAQGKILVSELKEVDTHDLLGRTEVEPEQSLIHKNIQNKVVLITGAGGSIGSEISRQVASSNPKKIIILDSNEYSLYSIQKEIETIVPKVDLYAVLANVTNEARIKDILKTFSVDTMYHTAAYKHVPLVEENPFEAVSNNIFGTKTCIEAAIESEVETFVLISTDKAVRPTNIMGATKRFSELILQSFSSEYSPNAKTKITMVRFGNVLGSSGSAIPLFQQQIKEGGPVTVTDKEVTRYFMSISEASGLVIQAGSMGQGGDVFVLDMGEPVKILELAKRLISLSGMELKDENNPNGDIEIVFTGLRPGEKLYEELLIGDNVSATEHKQILRAQEIYLHKNILDEYLEHLQKAYSDNDVTALKKILQNAISGYIPEKNVSDIILKQKEK
jgi:FlaA1/EpsC-like NDP-sugar epimerase